MASKIQTEIIAEQVAEAVNAGKPIYQMSKWWARRRSSVFRSTLIAAATKAPDDPAAHMDEIESMLVLFQPPFFPEPIG